ncbi:hypothetical protein [Ulvibacterium sp.]|uniref:hypothetical protein n=1 Tax=Ulvibacterium sp. TaxID=2665914 RepID=UPI003BABDF7F
MDITIELKKYIKDSWLRQSIQSLYENGKKNEKLLTFCLLIEIKHGLVGIDNMKRVFELFSKNSILVTAKNFGENREKVFSEELKDNKPQFARVVDKDTFKNYIGTFRSRKIPRIDKKKIVDEGKGWSTKNGIVWITPKEELDIVFENCKTERHPASTICDYLGFPREENLEYVQVNYSPNFPDSVFQPNSSNRLWHYEYNLFISHKKLDGYGRTWNPNSILFAKELVHKKSMYFDNLFKARYLGESESKFPINDTILDEAFNRLNS